MVPWHGGVGPDLQAAPALLPRQDGLLHRLLHRHRTPLPRLHKHKVVLDSHAGQHIQDVSVGRVGDRGRRNARLHSGTGKGSFTLRDETM